MLRTLIIQILIYSFSTPKAWGLIHNHTHDAFSCEGIKISKEYVFNLVKENEGTPEVDELKEDIAQAQSDDELIELAEMTSIKLYSDLLYKKINPPLRENRMPQEYISTIYSLCSGLNQLSDYKGKVYRVANLPLHVLAKFKEGGQWQNKGFLSASATKRGLRVFRDNTYRPVNVLFIIDSIHGKNISHISAWPTEEEVIFPAGSRFYIKKISRPIFSNLIHIWLNEAVTVHNTF